MNAPQGADAAMAVSANENSRLAETDLACIGCGKELPHNPKRKTQRCRSCTAIAIAKDPSIRAKAGAAIRRALEDPAVIRRRSRALSKALRQKMRDDPAYAAMQRENARRLGLSSTGIQRYPAGSAPRLQAGRSGSATKRRGIPKGYWDEYRRLVKNKEASAEEARRMITDQARADRQRRRAALEVATPTSHDARIRTASAALGAACARLAAREARL
jgi:hypothetical protein